MSAFINTPSLYSSLPFTTPIYGWKIIVDKVNISITALHCSNQDNLDQLRYLSLNNKTLLM